MRLLFLTRPSPEHVEHGVEISPEPPHAGQVDTCAFIIESEAPTLEMMERWEVYVQKTGRRSLETPPASNFIHHNKITSRSLLKQKT